MDYYQATEADIGLLAQFNRQLIQDEGHRNPMTLSELENRKRHWLKTEYQAIIFRHEAVPVAYALYRQSEKEIYLRHFFVSREHRRAGYGRQAMAILFSQVWPADRRVVLEVLANNRRGYAFWKAMGFADYAITLEKLPE